jgi:MFS family permease
MYQKPPEGRAVELAAKSLVPLAELTRARDFNICFSFVAYFSWGILIELYSNLFNDVIDPGNVSKASFYSTAAFSLYSVTSFFVSPVVSTLSDSVGRKPVFILAAFVYCLSGIVMGLFPSNRLFVALLGIQGAGDNSLAVGASLQADFVMAAPQGYSGSKEDGYFSQLIYGAVRLGAHNSKGDDYVEKELSVQNTVVLILQTVGILAGIAAGDGFYQYTGSLRLAIVASGTLLVPMVPLMLWHMPETVLHHLRKPLSWSAVRVAAYSQVDSFYMFTGNRRLWWVEY